MEDLPLSPLPDRIPTTEGSTSPTTEGRASPTTEGSLPPPSRRGTSEDLPLPSGEAEDRLVILDVDGFLIKRTYDPSLTHFRVLDETHLEAPRFLIEIRKDTQSFLSELLSRVPPRGKPGLRVGLWTSSKATTFQSYLPYIFGDLVRRLEFVWDRQMCDLDPDSRPGDTEGHKAHSTIKPLSRVLTNPMINEDRRWRADNVVIVDDSATKLRFNPPGSTRVVGWEEDLLSLVDRLAGV